jgi:hypothetical protein
LVSASRFRAYPVLIKASPPWRTPDVRRGEAHRVRTALRQQGKGPPDFAGYVKVVWIGCGTGSVCPAFVDLKAGRAIFPPALKVVSESFAIRDVPGIDDLRLIYRPDSRLLAVVGVRNEDNRLEGVYLYDWNDGQPKLIRSVPIRALCSSQGSMK